MKFIIFSLLIYSSLQAHADPEVKPPGKKVVLDQRILLEDDTKGIDTLFKNMIVVQKKAFERKNKFLLSSNLSFDFSDTPKTMYGASVGAGYAVAESLELHLSITPFFMANERASVKAVRRLQLEDGKTADLQSPDPKWEATGSFVWVFAYGKDAFGPYSIIRSDTFLKLSYSKIQFDENLTGNRISLFVGKTFFISKFLNFRFAAGFARQTSFINQKSEATTIGLIEPGLVWFL